MTGNLRPPNSHGLQLLRVFEEAQERLRSRRSANLSQPQTAAQNPPVDVLSFMVPGPALLRSSTSGFEPPAAVSDNRPRGYDQDDEAMIDSNSESSALDPNSQDSVHDFTGPEVMSYLEELRDVMVGKETAQDLEVVPGLKPTIVPHPHQRQAAAAIIRAGETDFKGLILADPPGSGKSLPALMAISATAKTPGDSPSVIVAPASCCQQGVDEIDKCSAEDTFKVLQLTEIPGPPISPSEAFQYDIIVTSYGYLSAEFDRVDGFPRLLAEYASGRTSRVPERPHVTLTSDLFHCPGAKKIGQYLILDEAHTIMNRGGSAYVAIQELRDCMEVCVMLAGTRLEHVWSEKSAPLDLLHGRPIESLVQKRFASAESRPSLTSSNEQQTAKWPAWMTEMITAVTLCRSFDLIQAPLPAVSREIFEFGLPAADLAASNEAFSAYLRIVQENKNSRGSQDRDENLPRLSKLIQAQQHAYHPALLDITQPELDAILTGLTNNDTLDIPNPERGQQLRKMNKWRADLAKNRNWRSARVDVIVDIVNQVRDTRPGDAVLIIDDSTYFLDILDVAFRNTHDPLICFRLDGRQTLEERAFFLEQFAAARGTRVMLASRLVGGHGLGVQCANVLIRCGPWWDPMWEDLAEGRVLRLGQTKPVRIFELRATGCRVEEHMVSVRDRKKRARSTGV